MIFLLDWKKFFEISAKHWWLLYCLQAVESQQFEQFRLVVAFLGILSYPMDFHTMMDLKRLSFAGTRGKQQCK